MAEGNNDIVHQGIVKEIAKNSVRISLLNVAACSSCHAKGACSVSEIDNKVIEVVDNSGTYKPGDKVSVFFEKSQGPKALFLGYLMPFILVFLTLVISLQFTDSEGLAGLLSLGVLVPYYLGLALFRNKLKSTFTFKINHS